MFARYFFYSLVLATSLAQAATCTYETWEWDVRQKKAVNLRKVQKDKSTLSPEEKSELETCTVCEEDQVEVKWAKLPPFKVCKKLADKVRRALKNSSGFQIDSIVGYRVGKSKGPLNEQGLRTQFSNHSFGTALDFNAEKNGLYDNCLKFSADCRLLRGGVYKKGESGSIDSSTPIYKAMIREGFKWGGEIVGRQKDFMHFSLSGL